MGDAMRIKHPSGYRFVDAGRLIEMELEKRSMTTSAIAEQTSLPLKTVRTYLRLWREEGKARWWADWGYGKNGGYARVWTLKPRPK